MISAHKIQESLFALRRLSGYLPSSRNNYFIRSSEILESAEKFDIGEINAEDIPALFDTGKERAQAGLFDLPFEVTYVEATLGYEVVPENRTVV